MNWPGDVLALMGLLGLMIVFIWIHFSSPLLTQFGPFSPNSIKYFVTGVTVSATLFSAFVGALVRNHFLQRFETPLQNIVASQPLLPLSGPLDRRKRKDIEILDRKWRGALGIDGIKEKFKNWKFMLVYLVCGLITPAVVTTLTPEPIDRMVPYHPLIPDANYGQYINSSFHPCVGMIHNSSNLPSTAFQWPLKNGSAFYAVTDGMGYGQEATCPTSLVMSLSSGINTESPDDYVYADSGIAVRGTAIGASSAIFKGLIFQDLSQHYGVSLVNTTQCVPVMQSNPVECRRGGNLTFVNDSKLQITSADGDCGYTESYQRNLTRDSVMIAGMCMAGLNGTDGTNQSIGRLMILLGAVTDPEGQATWAWDLAGAMNDPNKTAGIAPGSEYAVTCTVNPQNSFVYRLVTLNLQAGSTTPNASAYSYYLSGGEACTPVHKTISNSLFATAAIANYDLVMQGQDLDGYVSIIQHIAGSFRGPPYAFNNSRNTLEDTLGLISALAVSSMPTNYGNLSADALGDDAYAFVGATRLGTRSLEALVLLIPPLGSFLILGYLFAESLWHHRRPGKGVYESLPKGQRPKRYIAESIQELIRLISLRDNHKRLSAASQSLELDNVRVYRSQIEDQHTAFSEPFLYQDTRSVPKWLSVILQLLLIIFIKLLNF